MIAIIANPNALHFNTNDLRNIILMLRHRGCDVNLFFTQKAGDGTDIANKIASKYSIIAAYGGDGIINEIINADLGSSALGLLPAGTTNVLAIDTGIGLDVIKAAKLFVKPNFKNAYLGCINDKKFILMVGSGFDADSVLNVNQNLKRLSGKLSYFFAGIVSYLKSDNKTIDVRIGKDRFKARWVIVSKAKKYAGRFIISDSVDIDKPCFDVCLFEPVLNNFADLPFDNLVLFSGLHLKKIPFVKHIITDDDIEISEGNVQIDGDFFGFGKVYIKLCKKPIRIVVP